MGKKPKTARRPNPPKSRRTDLLPPAAGVSDSDDEIDTFHKQRDVIPLDVHAGESEEDDLAEPVFTLEGISDDDTDDSRSDNNDDLGGANDNTWNKAYIAK